MIQIFIFLLILFSISLMLKIQPNEKKLFEKVIETAKLMNPIITPRVAGGWVRDKILGIKCYDIDIALNETTGFEFANKFLEVYYGKDHPRVHVIKSNPDRSKHLETAVVNIEGLSVDFVNLRSEKYTDTRIPIIEVGTPKEDAFRRDITINTLFYNIITKEVEDFTGKGLHDIENKIIRTPLDPMTTFLDDPLRIVRVFRFRAKFDFTISPEIYKALKNEEVKIALEKKVSKERINIELFKMIEYENGALGIFEIIKTDFVEVIFYPQIGNKTTYEKACENYKNCKDLVEIFNYRENMWIFNLYIILVNYSILFKKCKKKYLFLNAVILRESLCSSCKNLNIINSIESGLLFLLKLFLLAAKIDIQFIGEDIKRLEIENSSLKNSLEMFYQHFSEDITFIVKTLGKLWFETLLIFWMYCKNSFDLDINVASLIKMIEKKETYKILDLKPVIETRDLHEKLQIDIIYTKCFIIESIILYFDNKALANDEIITILKDSKKEVLKKYSYFELNIPCKK